MKDIEMKINVGLAQMDELSAEDQELVQTAMKATDNSNAKYSHFRVGAALQHRHSVQISRCGR